MEFFAKLGAMIALLLAPFFGGFRFSNYSQVSPVVSLVVTQNPVIAPTTTITPDQSASNPNTATSSNEYLDTSFIWLPYQQDPLHRYFDSGGQLFDRNNTNPVNDSDPSSFVVSVGEPGDDTSDGIERDKNHIYYYDSIIPGADPATFEIIANVDVDNTFDAFYAKDKNNVYWDFDKNGQVNVIEGADPSSFIAVSDPTDKEDAKDKNHIYLNGQIVQ